MKYLPDLIPHDYMCPCIECRAMTAAIVARNPDGSYFYTEEELEQLATKGKQS